MNLSIDTIDVLKNFSNINQNILVKPERQYKQLHYEEYLTSRA